MNERAVSRSGEQGSGAAPLPAEDAGLQADTLTLDDLATRWHRAMSAGPIGAEAMRGADRRRATILPRNQRRVAGNGTPVPFCGLSIAAAIPALRQNDRSGHSPQSGSRGRHSNAPTSIIA